jgi:hypothetical protein
MSALRVRCYFCGKRIMDHDDLCPLCRSHLHARGCKIEAERIRARESR